MWRLMLVSAMIFVTLETTPAQLGGGGMGGLGGPVGPGPMGPDGGGPFLPPSPGGIPGGWGEVPDGAAYALRQAMRLDSEGRHSEAIDEFRRALNFDSSDAFVALVYNQLAYSYLSVSDGQLSLEAAQQAVSFAEIEMTLDTLGDVYRYRDEEVLMCEYYARACTAADAAADSIGCSNFRQYC